MTARISPLPAADAPSQACDAECPVRRTAELVGYKWTTLIVRDLLPGKRRYSDLLRSVSGISPRVLAERLRELEGAGLLTRTVFPTVPPTTEYALTELGYGLLPVIEAMAQFGQALAAAQQAVPATEG